MVEKESSFFNCSDLIVTDSSGESWVFLHQYLKRRNPLGTDLEIQGDYGQKGCRECWKLCEGCFVTKHEFETLRTIIQDANFMDVIFPKNGEQYSLFNREIPWSSACEGMKQNQWIAYMIETGEKEYIQTQIPIIIACNFTDDGTINFKMKVREQKSKRDILRQVASVMPATIPMMFELGGDLSRVDSHNFRIPCVKLLEDLKLRQQKHEGLFFDETNQLVAFDGSELGICEGLVIRMEHLNRFLDQNELVLFWTCKGEKEYFHNLYNARRSVWSAFAYLNAGEIRGAFQLKRGDFEENAEADA